MDELVWIKVMVKGKKKNKFVNIWDYMYNGEVNKVREMRWGDVRWCEVMWGDVRWEVLYSIQKNIFSPICNILKIITLKYYLKIVLNNYWNKQDRRSNYVIIGWVLKRSLTLKCKRVINDVLQYTCIPYGVWNLH